MHKGSYIRIGDSDEHMTEYEIYCLNSYKDGVQEDKRPIKIATIDDLDKEKINAFLEKAKKDKPNFSKFSNEKILKLCGIIENSTGKIYPTLSGMMLFGEYPQGFLPQLFVACVAVPGTKLAETGEIGQRFNDNQRIEGTIDEMLEQTLAFIRRNISTKVIIDDDGNRKDIPEYPMKALREAIANALVHRDYSVSRESAYIYVQIYTDRIEIINPGDLYGNNRLELLGTDVMLEVRNKNIIKLIEINGNIIENRHTGIATMFDEMKKMHLPEPKLESLRGDFKVTLWKEWTEENKAEVDRSEQKWIEVDRGRQMDIFENLDDKILHLIKQNPSITQFQMSKELSVGRTTITNHIKKLKENNTIERIGADYGGYWKIK